MKLFSKRKNIFGVKLFPISCKLWGRGYCEEVETSENYNNPNAKKQRKKKIYSKETWEAFDQRRREEDVLFRTFNRDYRIAFIINTRTARKAQEKHKLDSEAALLLGESLNLLFSGV